MGYLLDRCFTIRPRAASQFDQARVSASDPQDDVNLKQPENLGRIHILSEDNMTRINQTITLNFYLLRLLFRDGLCVGMGN